MIASTGVPAYQQIAGELRHQIDTGALLPGDVLPSTRQLMRAHGVSSTVAKAAVNQLRAEGRVFGQPGKGVFVAQRPVVRDSSGGPSSEGSPAVATLLQEIRDELRQLRRRLDAMDRDGRPGPDSPQKRRSGS